MSVGLVGAVDPSIATVALQQVPIDPLEAPGKQGYSAILVIVVAAIAAFGGGALGAAIGALPAFVLTGIMTIGGAVATAIGVEGAAATMYAAAFGPLFGPHVAFAGGAAAHAYAAKYHPELQEREGWDYHHAKNILSRSHRIRVSVCLGRVWKQPKQTAK